jgi:uncharacterized membrane protein
MSKDERTEPRGTELDGMDIFLIALSLMTIVATGLLYSRLPARIPMQWGLDGQVNWYGSRASIWLTASLPAALYALMKIVPRVDPRRDSYRKHAAAYRSTVVATIILMVAIHGIVLAASLGVPVAVDTFVKAGVGVLLVVIGNVLTQARPNYTFGIRLPWTLASERVWRKTHRLGGPVFVAAGLGFIGVAPFSGVIAILIPMGLLFGGLAGLSVYSYVLFEREQRG